ncbi:hypothetical protein AgCh_033324 [Apium graveolens]
MDGSACRDTSTKECMINDPTDRGGWSARKTVFNLEDEASVDWFATVRLDEAAIVRSDREFRYSREAREEELIEKQIVEKQETSRLLVSHYQQRIEVSCPWFPLAKLRGQQSLPLSLRGSIEEQRIKAYIKGIIVVDQRNTTQCKVTEKRIITKSVELTSSWNCSRQMFI